MSSGNVRVSGWLRKSPPEKKLRKNAWKKRWFVLRSGRLSGDPNLLEYYKHEGSKKPIGAISLDECSQIDANVPVKYDRKDHTQQYVFDIVTKTRTYYLVAENGNEMSFWVRCLCDLCGFGHEESDQPADLGTQQQTFRPSQPITGREFHNGTSPLLQNEVENSLSEVPMPLPRPRQTITKRSILIRNPRVNGQTGGVHESLGESSPVTSGQPSGSGTTGQPREDPYVVAEQPSTEQSVDGEYLFLADFTTAQSTTVRPTNPNLLSTTYSNMGERRSSTDSVFTHDGPVSDNESEVIIERSLPPTQMRYTGSSMRKKRLDSMPDCPPPPPPIKDCPRQNVIEEQNFSMSPGDLADDVRAMDFRKKSYPPTTGGFSPIDDTQIKRVPLNLQEQHNVDDMGRPLQGSITSSRYSPYVSSGYETSEYMNTADTSYVGNLQSHRYESQQPSVGTFSSVSNKSAASMMTNSSVFFNSPLVPPDPRHHQLYNSPSPVPHPYVSPRNPSSHQPPLSNKGCLYSSTHTLGVPKGPPMQAPISYASPHPGPRMRRSSSVGQLEKVTNELSTEGDHPNSLLRNRRSSIDHRRGKLQTSYNPSFINQSDGSVPLEQFARDADRIRSLPPPRPPKSEQAFQHPPQDHFKPTVNNQRNTSSDYFNISECGVEIPQDGSSSPLHTEVVAVVMRPDPDPISSPLHNAPFLSNDSTEKKTNNDNVESNLPSRSSSESSSSSTGSSSGRSSAAGVYNMVVTPLRDIQTSSHEPSRRIDNTVGKPSIYDNQKPPGRCASPNPLYDSPGSKPTHCLPAFDDQRPNYEVMFNQADQLPPTSDNMQAYTCMAGASTLVNSPSFAKPIGPTLGRSEAPPVNRELKPGRKSLGSDGGASDIRMHYSRGSREESHFDMSGHASDSPVSPIHTVIMHNPPSSAVGTTPGFDPASSPRLHDRLQPPERPPKHSSYSPRTPPAGVTSTHPLGRPQSYGVDRTRYDSHNHPGDKSQSTPAVPCRPPKPMSMLPGATVRDERSQQPSRSNRSRNGFAMSSVVPPAPSEPVERPTTYVELDNMSKPTEALPGSANGVSVGDRLVKGDGVEYWVLDPDKTEALQKSKEEREKQQKRAPDTRSVKSGKT